MSKLRPIFWGKVKKGKLDLYDKEKFILWLAKLEGKEIELRVDKYKEKRTLAQNRYYWIICTIVAEETGHDPEEIHQIFKSMFLKTWTKLKHKRIQRIQSTTELDTKEFTDYVDKCSRFAGQELGIFIPLPGEIDLEEGFIR